MPSSPLPIPPSSLQTASPPAQVFYAITFSKELNSIGGNLYAGAPTLTLTLTPHPSPRTPRPSPLAPHPHQSPSPRPSPLTLTPTLTLALSPARACAPGALFGALVELPAYLALAPATNRLGRRAAYAGFMLLAAAACVVLQLELAGARSP